MNGIAHLHRGALRAHAGERQTHGGIRRAHLNLLLGNTERLRGHDAEKVVRTLPDLRRVVLNRDNAARIHGHQSISSPAALRTMAQAQRHAATARPTRAVG